jgi:AcrR family transcriptional regulator
MATRKSSRPAAPKGVRAGARSAEAVAAKARLPQRRAPASAKSEQRVRDILRAGREVFAERGYERSTTTEIAQRLGVSEATVFTYFRGKRELCVRVIADWYDEVTAEIEHGLPGDKPVRAQFEFFVHAHLRLFLGHGTGMCALVLAEGRDKGPSDLGAAVLPLHRRYTAPLMDLLARGQADGTVRSDVPLRTLRALVLGPMEHLLWEAVSVRKPIDIDAQARALSMLLWSALAAPGAELAALRTLRGAVERSLDQAAQA